MRIGILCAGDDELAPFLNELEHADKKEFAMLTFYLGRAGGADAVALYSGAGKVNAAIAAQLLISAFGCGAVINAGTAGGIADGVELFDTVVATQTAYHDADEDILTQFHPYLPSIWMDGDACLLSCAREAAELIPQRVLFGRIVSGDRFIEEDGREALKRRYSPLCADMESAAAAHVCHAFGVPFLSIRTITDTADSDGKVNFEKNCKAASAIAAVLTISTIKALVAMDKT